MNLSYFLSVVNTCMSLTYIKNILRLIKMLLFVEPANIKGSYRFSAHEASYSFVGVFFI